MLDDIDLDIPEDGSSSSGGGTNFRLIGGVLGVVLLLALIAAAVYTFVILPGREASLPQDDVAAQMTSTAEALALVEDADEAQVATASPSTVNTATSIPATLAPSATEITPIFTAVVNGETATVNALLTQAALSQTQAAGGIVATATVVLPTALPNSGFADDVGLPGLLAATALFVVVILFARRMRTSER